MLLEIAAFVASVGLLVLAVGFLLISIGLWVRIVSQAPPGAIPLVGPSPVPDIPESITDWISQESEPWAQEELRRKAESLYRDSEDWTKVEIELRDLDAETPVPGDLSAL